jgi:hypothetical protein
MFMSVENRLNSDKLSQDYWRNLKIGTQDIQEKFIQSMRSYKAKYSEAEITERVNSCFKEVNLDNSIGTSLQRTDIKEMEAPLPKRCSSEMKVCKEEKNQNIEIKKTEGKVQKVVYNRFNLFNAEELKDKSMEEKYDNYMDFLKTDFFFSYPNEKEINERVRGCLRFLNERKEEGASFLNQKQQIEKKIKKQKSKSIIKSLNQSLDQINLKIKTLDNAIKYLIEDPSRAVGGNR